MGKNKENSFQKNESRVQFELPYILTRQTTQRASEQFELIPEIFTQKKNCGKIKSAKIQKKLWRKFWIENYGNLLISFRNGILH